MALKKHKITIYTLFFIYAFILFSSRGSYAFKKRNITYIQSLNWYNETLRFLSPVDVWVGIDDEIYILDSTLSAIFIFNKDLSAVDTIDKSNGLSYPLCGAVDKKGLIYISEETPGKGMKSRIAVFDRLGRKRKDIILEGFPGSKDFITRDIELDQNGTFYLAGGLCKPLVILSREGRFLKTIQPEEVSKQDGKISRADVSGIALTGEYLCLLSESFGKVYLYTKDGELLSSFGKKGGGRGGLSRPEGIAIDYDEKIYYYIMDYLRQTLLVYDSSGSFLDEFGGSGDAPGWFSYPKGICVDSQGRLFIADTFNKRVQVFQTRL